MDRRKFIKGTLAGTAAAALSSCVPVRPRRPFTKNGWQEFTTVKAKTACNLCPNACPVTATVVDGDLVGTLPNPALGWGLCSRGLSAKHLYYHPDRILSPVARNGVKEPFADLLTALKRLRDAGTPERFVVLSASGYSLRRTLLERFARVFGTPNVVFTELHSAASAAYLGTGAFAEPGYDLAAASSVLSIGCDLLDGWVAPVAAHGGYGRLRSTPLGEARRLLVTASSYMNRTAARSDRWLRLNPGTGAAFALSIAHVLLAEKLADTSAVSGVEAFAALCEPYEPAAASAVTGVDADTVRELAKTLAEMKPALVVADPADAFAAYAALALDAFLGAFGETVRFAEPTPTSLPPLSAPASTAHRIDGADTDAFLASPSSFEAVADHVLAGSPYPVEVLLLDGVNPLHDSPAPARWREALARVPLVVSNDVITTETSEAAGAVIPDRTMFERYDALQPALQCGRRALSLMQPVMPVRGETTDTNELLLRLAEALGHGEAFPWKSAEEALKAHLAWMPGDGELPGEGETWERFVAVGAWEGKTGGAPSGKFKLPDGALVERGGLSLKPEAPPEGKLRLLPHESIYSACGGYGTFLPYVVEEMGAEFDAFYDVVAEVGEEAAARLGIDDGGWLWVESAAGRLKVRARVTRVVHPDVVAVGVGLGHTVGRFSAERGVNPLALVKVIYNRISGAVATGATAVKVYSAVERAKSEAANG